MQKTEIEKEKKIIIDLLKKYAVTLRPFFELEKSLKEYSASLYEFKTHPVHLQRQELVKDKIKEKAEKLFGRDYQKELQLNLDGGLALNIVDHLQVLNHPVIIVTNFISSVNKFLQSEKQDAIVVIASGDVPPNNYFSKNGFIFHDKRVPIFSNSERELCSYYVPKRDFDFVAKLKTVDRWKDFNRGEQTFLNKEKDLLQSYDYRRCADYKDQISLIVKNTWPRLFEEKVRATLPELFYITQEELTSECLIDILQEDNIISQCLFDKKFRQQILDAFRGIVVTWREDEGKGTHFFWRKYPGRDQSLRLFVEGDKLVPHDERFKDLAVPLQRETIIELLKSREIYPSLFMIFGVLNFYCGIKPLVGHGSLTYLNLVKDAWLKVASKSDFPNEEELIKSVAVNGLTMGPVLFFKRVGDKIKTLYAYDIIYDGGMKQEYLEKIFGMKFNEPLSISLIDIYNYYANKYIPVAERIEPKITADDLANAVFDWL